MIQSKDSFFQDDSIPSSNKNQSGHQSSKPNVLLVNDEEFLLEGYKLRLQSHFEVYTADNG